jgi:predicted RNA-binding protein YlqC (UPF0109 family)
MSLSPLIEYVVKTIVAEPDAVSVNEQTDRNGVTYYVKVAPNDVGKVIGKAGRVVSAIRYVVSAAAAKAKLKAFVKVDTE